MKRGTEQPLKAVIEEFLQRYKLNDKLAESKVMQSWEKVVGAMIARHTQSLSIRKKTLYVKIDSAALRNELLFAREKIMKSLNKEAGREVIQEIVFN